MKLLILANAIHLTYVVLMLGQRRRRWPNMKTTWVLCESIIAEAGRDDRHGICPQIPILPSRVSGTVILPSMAKHCGLSVAYTLIDEGVRLCASLIPQSDGFPLAKLFGHR